jgi:hypothetical protein
LLDNLVGRKSGLPDLRIFDPISGKPEIGAEATRRWFAISP